MINIKVYNGDDVQTYSFEKDTPPSEIKAALIADRNERSDLNIEQEVREGMGVDLDSKVKEEMRGNSNNPMVGLLDWIGNHEASRHGYNQVSGINNSMPLTEMTIAQVQAAQRAGEIKRLPGAASNAAGRYQFMPDSLDTAMRRTGITPDTLMTPEIQDRLALTLAERRGLSSFVRGEMSLEDFSNNMAKEWAFLPVVSGERAGQSEYEGVANNRALVSVDEALNVFSTLREEGAIFTERTPDGQEIRLDDTIPQYFERVADHAPHPSRAPSPDRSVVTPEESTASYEEAFPAEQPTPRPQPMQSVAAPEVPQPRAIKQSERFRTTAGIHEEMAAITSAGGGINDFAGINTTGESDEQDPLNLFTKPEFRGGNKTLG